MTQSQSSTLLPDGAAVDAAPRIERLCDLALRSLKRMYIHEQHGFGFCLRGGNGQGPQLEGLSNRYTAAALIGLACEPDDVVADVLDGDTVAEVCQAMGERCTSSQELGEVALALWCARTFEHPVAEPLLQHLRKLAPQHSSYPTVEVSWALMAQAIPGDVPRDDELAHAIAKRLLASFNPQAGLFSHWPAGARAAWSRAHVACFADLVYPIQSLAHYHMAYGSDEALAAAQRCAEQMCAGQGSAGQWWWHHDSRSGKVIEEYPVYSVHQDSMAPMALLAAAEAGGQPDRFNDSIRLGLDWLDASPELDGANLFDGAADVVWRKVFRREPAKLVRRLRAGTTRVHPSLRLPSMQRSFPPDQIDHETRPYHMGWILYAWRNHRGSAADVFNPVTRSN